MWVKWDIINIFCTALFCIWIFQIYIQSLFMFVIIINLNSVWFHLILCTNIVEKLKMCYLILRRKGCWVIVAFTFELSKTCQFTCVGTFKFWNILYFTQLIIEMSFCAMQHTHCHAFKHFPSALKTFNISKYLWKCACLAIFCYMCTVLPLKIISHLPWIYRNKNSNFAE